MNVLKGLENFLYLVNENWTTIMVIIGLGLLVGKKAKDFFSKSDEEKIAIAKAQINQTILKMITEAELDYEEWNKAGSIKRSQVIEEVFEKYPILSKVVDQTELIKWIDEQIDNALDTLRNIIKENQEEVTENQ